MLVMKLILFFTNIVGKQHQVGWRLANLERIALI